MTPTDDAGARASAVPQAVDGTEPPTIPLFELLRWAGGSLAGLVPGPVREAGRELARAVADAPVAAGAWLTAGPGAVAGAAWWRRRREAARRRAAGTGYDRLARLLAEHGVPRDPWQTPREHLGRIHLRLPTLPREPVDALVANEEARRYAVAAPGSVADEERWLDEVRTALTP